MPAWVKVAVDAWTAPAAVTDGQVFRPVNRGDRVSGEAMSEKVVWQMLRRYAATAGVPGIAPHDCRRYAGGPDYAEWVRPSSASDFLRPDRYGIIRHSTRHAYGMQSIIDPKLLTRLRVGPLAQYFDVYLTRVQQDGFLSSSVPCPGVCHRAVQ